MVIDVAVVGAAGYAGAELVRRLVEHPKFNLKVITSDSDAGKSLAELYPAFTGLSDLEFLSHNAPEVKQCTAAFLAVPHKAAMAMVPSLLDAGVAVFDLSADYRLKDAEIYKQWYDAEHTSPELLDQCAFGLPELFRKDLNKVASKRLNRKPALVACAGCYPTATSLAAFPAVDAGWVQTPVYVQAISGVTGAGRSANNRTHFCHANENAEAYGVATHRHTPEIEQILGLPGGVLFIPHLAPLSRGLLSTVTMRLTDEAAADFSLNAAHKLYEDFYEKAPFVQVMPLGVQPQTNSVMGSNYAQVGLAYDERTQTLVATGAIDNLCKGAASQAIQCANIVFGLDETTGLEHMANPV